MPTTANPSDQAIPTADELSQAIRELPDLWLPLAAEVTEWAKPWLEAWNAHDLDALTALVTDDISWDDPATLGETVHGRDEFRAFTRTFFDAIPDVHFEGTGSPYLAPDGPRLAVPWRMTGTFTGELAWWGKRYGPDPPAFAPTGRRLDLEGVDLYELRDGLLARWTIHYDLFALSQQLGLVPPTDSRFTRPMLGLQRVVAARMRRRAQGR
jgi:steroid delta-isomerase-like uncharacterized protein